MAIYIPGQCFASAAGVAAFPLVIAFSGLQGRCRPFPPRGSWTAGHRTTRTQENTALSQIIETAGNLIQTPSSAPPALHTPFDPPRISHALAKGLALRLVTAHWCVVPLYTRFIDIYSIRYALSRQRRLNKLPSPKHCHDASRATFVRSCREPRARPASDWEYTRWAPRSDRMGAAQFAAVRRDYLALCGSLGASQTSA